MKVDKSKKRERSASPKVKKPKRKYRNDRSKKSRHSDSSDSSDSSGKESMSESESSEEDKRVSKKSKKPKPRYSKRRTRSSSDSSRSPSPEKRKKVTKTSSRRSDSDSEDDKDEKRRLKKKVKKRSPSPKKKRSPTPKKKRSPSPKRKRSPTPKRKRSPTPKKKRSPTPKKRRSPSPKKKRSPSPKKKRSLSPKKKRSPSPKKKRSLSPKKKRSPSPKKKRSLSPKKKRSPTPKKKRSPTPKRKRKESESPPRKRKTRKPSDSPPRRRKRSPTPDKKKRRSKSPRRRRSRSPSKEKRRRKKSRSESKEKKSKRASSSSESPPRRRKDRSRSKSKDRRSRKSPDRRRRRRSRDESESDRSSSESPIRKEKEKTKKRRSPTPDKKKNRRSRSVERKRKERSRSIEKKRKKSKSRSTTPVESRKVKELKERSKARSPSTDKKPLIKQDKSSSPVLKKRKERSESPETKKSETAEIESNGTVKKDSNNKVSVDQKQTVNNGHAKETSIKEDSLKSTPPIKKDTKVGDATNTKTEETNVKETKDSENKNIGKSTEVEVSKTLNEDCKIESSKGKNLVKEEVKPEGLEVKEEPKKNIKKDEITPEINKLNKEKPDKVKPKIEIVKITKSQVSKAKEEKSSVNSNKEVGKIRVKDEIKKEDERKDSKTSKDAVNKILLKDKIKEEMNHIKKEIKSREDSKSRESKADRDLKARSEKDSQRRSRDSGRDYRDSSRDSSRRKDDSKSSKKEKSPDRKKELSSIEEEMKKRKERIEAWRNARKQQNGETDDVKEVKDKKWSLEDDDDEEETQNKDQNKKTADQKIIKQEESEDEDLDPLDAYMKSINKEINKIAPAGKKGSNKPTSNGKAKTITVVTTVVKKAEVKVKPEVMEQNQDALEYSSEEEKPEDVTATDFHDIKKRKKDLEAADHSKIYYAPFKRDFYVEVPELTRMTPDEVKLYRESLGDIQVRGKNVPKPIKAWSQAGLNTKIMNVLKKCNYEKPTPIQAQAIPTVMSGRDMIGIAKTGSGKTLAFVLPMLRHCLYQPALDENDGPIAIMMTPTRELALQIYKETRKFCKPLKLTVACIYGGSGISEQIAELKKGAEIIVCTPGRMIDMLSANNGKVTNCRRCTYLVLDEADRMFDMGFEPQVMRIIDNIRPDRQTVLFSATFPRQMEAVARKVLKKPVEIQVGGRSIVCSDVEQHALVIDADNKFLKLLELLGVYSEQGSCLVFVEKQETADTVFKDLLKKGYPCLSLHGGMDQFDRDSTIADFKNGVMKIMVSTSVAARGLDVKKLILVVNYDCPNHYEDYVHRVGRTGRAGNKGTAFTLLTYEQGRNAGDIVKAFELSKREPPEDVLALWNGYKEQMEKEGKKVKVNSGFSGKGFKFNADEEAQVSDAKKMQKFALGMQDSDDEAEAAENAMEKIEADLEKAFSNKPKVAVAPEVIEAKKVNQQILKESGQNVDKDKLSKASNIAALLERKLTSGQVVDRNTVATAHIMQGGALESLTGVGLAKQLADKVNAKLNYKAVEIEKDKEETKEANVRYEEEIDINDFPQQARWRITSKEIIEQVREISEAGVTVRGIYIPPNKKANEDEKRLHLYIESLNERSIQIAKAEIKRLLKEELIKAESHSYRPQQTGRYKVV